MHLWREFVNVIVLSHSHRYNMIYAKVRVTLDNCLPFEYTVSIYNNL